MKATQGMGGFFYLYGRQLPWSPVATSDKISSTFLQALFVCDQATHYTVGQVGQKHLVG